MNIQHTADQAILCELPVIKLPEEAQHTGEDQSNGEQWHISKYHELIRQKKELMRGWELIRNRLSLVKHQSQKLLRRRCLDEKKKQYITKYRGIEKFQRKQSTHKKACSSPTQVEQLYFMQLKTNKEAHLKSINNRLQKSKLKACQIKTQKNFFEKFVEQRRQLEMQQKIEIAQSVRKHKLQLKLCKQRVIELKKERILDDIQKKITREKQQCTNLSQQLKRVKTASSKLATCELSDLLQPTPRDSRASRKLFPKML